MSRLLPDARFVASIVLCSLLASVASGLAEETRAAVDTDHIVLTGVSAAGPDYRNGGPLELKTKTYVLRLSAEAKPISFKTLPDGKELLDTTVPSDGFYLECRSGKIFFNKLGRNKDGLFVVKTNNETQRVAFSVVEKDKYLAFQIKELYGIPSSCNFSLHFGMKVDPSVRVMALDYMTDGKQNLPVNWPWLWHRNPQDPLGGFALYHKTSDDDEDDTILRVWVDEGLPHPQVPEKWDLDRARRWVKDWMSEFSDTSVLWYAYPQNEQEMYDLIPYLEKAKLKEVHLMPWIWASPKHHGWVRTDVFKKGAEGLRAYSDALAAKGMRVTLHYNFCEIPLDDPVFVGTKPNDGLGSWGRGTLGDAVGKDDTTIRFRPAPGTELPFQVDPYWYMCDPPTLDGASHFNFVRIGDEIVKVGEFENTSTDTWILTNCTRGLGSTEPAAHTAGDAMTGLLAMYGVFYLPNPNTPLFDTMTSDAANLVNDCHLSHLEYDGVCPAYWGNSEWMYRKYLGQFYGKVNRPLTFGSGYGRAQAFGYFEYMLNAVKKMQDKDLGPRGDIGVRIRTDHLIKPASTVDEANFRLSQPAAFNNHSFSIFLSVHFPSEWRKYGRLDEICQLVADWKEASGNMTDAQREQIRATLYPPNLRGYQSDVIWRLRRGDSAFEIRPSKNPLTRKTGDVRWGLAGGELEYVMPQQYVKPGQELVLENPHAQQPPQFSIRVMTATDAADKDNIVLQPSVDEFLNKTETKVSAEGDAIVVSADNPQVTDLIKRDPESMQPYWNRKVDLSKHRAVGMWVTGDKSNAVLVLALPGKHEYAIQLDFEGKRYFEIPNAEAFAADSAWGGPENSAFGRFDYQTEWLKLGFGKVPANTKATAKVEGITALKETSAELQNPVIHVDGGRLTVQGTIKSGQYLEYTGGERAIVYDENWNKVQELPVTLDNYTMPTGWHTLSITTEQTSPRPWLSVRFITEGEPMIVPRSK